MRLLYALGIVCVLLSGAVLVFVIGMARGSAYRQVECEQSLTFQRAQFNEDLVSIENHIAEIELDRSRFRQQYLGAQAVVEYYQRQLDQVSAERDRYRSQASYLSGVAY